MVAKLKSEIFGDTRNFDQTGLMTLAYKTGIPLITILDLEKRKYSIVDDSL